MVNYRDWELEIDEKILRGGTKVTLNMYRKYDVCVMEIYLQRKQLTKLIVNWDTGSRRGTTYAIIPDVSNKTVKYMNNALFLIWGKLTKFKEVGV